MARGVNLNPIKTQHHESLLASGGSQGPSKTLNISRCHIFYHHSLDVFIKKVTFGTSGLKVHHSILTFALWRPNTGLPNNCLWTWRKQGINKSTIFHGDKQTRKKPTRYSWKDRKSQFLASLFAVSILLRRKSGQIWEPHLAAVQEPVLLNQR